MLRSHKNKQLKMRRGAAANQYALVLGLIVVLALASIGLLGRQVASLFSGVSNRLGATTNGSLAEGQDTAIPVCDAGSIDPTFPAGGSGANNDVLNVVQQSDGKFVIMGWFTSYNGVTRNYLARLNSDGSLDTGFMASGAGFNSYIQGALVQSDGKIIAGGGFTSVHSTARQRIARLNADGTLDTAWPNVTTGANNGVWTFVQLAANKVLIGGAFSSYNSTERNGIARLNADGSLDTAYAPSGVNGWVQHILPQPDGKTIILGNFTTLNGVAAAGIGRLNADGTIDSSFNHSASSTSPAVVYSAALQPDGKILIGGQLTTVLGQSSNKIARLNADGTLDTTFAIGSGFNGTVWDIALQSNGQILTATEAHSFNGATRHGFARLNADGSLDASYNTTTISNTNYMTAILPLPDNSAILSGLFTQVAGVSRGRIARLKCP